MDDLSHHAQPPAGWLEALDRGDAQYAAGELVPGAQVMRDLYESIAEMEAKRADPSQRRAKRHR